jgi:phage tail protein X
LFESHARYFRVERHDLVYLKFILEAYEGLAVLSTVDREGAIVRIGYPHFSACDVDALLQALAGEIDLQEVPMPAGFADGLPDIPIRKVAEHA